MEYQSITPGQQKGVLLRKLGFYETQHYDATINQATATAVGQMEAAATFASKAAQAEVAAETVRGLIVELGEVEAERPPRKSVLRGGRQNPGSGTAVDTATLPE